MLVTPYYNLVMNAAGKSILDLCNGSNDARRIAESTGNSMRDASKFIRMLEKLEVLELSE